MNRFVLPLFLFLLISLGCENPNDCIYNGNYYITGSQFLSIDGLQTCKCNLSVLSCEEKKEDATECTTENMTVCGQGKYCDFEKTCGEQGSKGSCNFLEKGICQDTGKLVCGCNGKTYKTVCHARLDGISIRDNKACQTSETKECNSAVDCKSNEICFKLINRCDEKGICTPLDSSELCSDIGKVVCGCDGKTYKSDCEALRSNTTIRALFRCL